MKQSQLDALEARQSLYEAELKRANHLATAYRKAVAAAKIEIDEWHYLAEAERIEAERLEAENDG